MNNSKIFQNKIQFFHLIIAAFILGTFQASLYAEGQNTLPPSELYAKVISVESSAVIADSSYSAVDMNWLLETFNNNFIAFGGQSMESNNSDCFDYARLYCSLAQMQSRDNIAIGEFWYTPEGTNQTYAIVVAYAQDGLHYIDPIKGSEIDLSEKELEACSFLRM